MNQQSEFEKLKKGELIGCRELRLNGLGLTSFPLEILELADTLELLDLSDNQLSQIPDEIAKFNKLKIAFFSANKFETFPPILFQCTELEMIGFKSNELKSIAENSFPIKLRWLILTQNQLINIPKSIGNCNRLQKLMLAGNQLSSLPEELKFCTNLELLRISANNFSELPVWLWTLPRLAWLAYGGNLCNSSSLVQEIPAFDWNNFTMLNKLGEGASGVISKAKDNNLGVEVAIKVFKGGVTSDGFPESEMQAFIQADKHPNLVEVLGKITNHPQSKEGLVMKLLPIEYHILGGSPTFQTCTRDVFDAKTSYNGKQILTIVKQMAETCLHLHQKGIMHGDFYAHNILIDNDLHTILSDFGAATQYLFPDIKHEQIEVRAWACLLEDLLSMKNISSSEDQKIIDELEILTRKCMSLFVDQRPTFVELVERLELI